MSNPSTVVAIPTPNPTSAEWSLYVDSQTFNLTFIDGTQVPLSLTDINQFIYIMLSSMAAYGFEIGFTGMLMFVLVILTTGQKARRPIFILNFIALFLSCVRAILQVAARCTQYIYGVGENFLDAANQYSKTSYIPVQLIVDCIINPLLYAAILASLILQVRVVFAAEPRTQQLITLLLSAYALVIVAFWLTFNIYTTKMLFFNFLNDNPDFNLPHPFLYNSVRIMFIVFVGISCLLFIYKLFVTIQRRRRMGFRKFGPLHILFIMFGQCLIIPRTFSFNL
jgi:pheromone alpha factor receptor